MSKRRKPEIWPPLGLLLLVLTLGTLSACSKQPEELRLGGGPSGGTFQGYAEALAGTLREASPQVQIEVIPSGGSVANLVSLNRGELDLGLVYAGDAYLGRRGRLERVQPAPKNIRLVARLYGAGAQLVVRQNSRILRVSELDGARVAIGNPGSGTALAAHRYFSSLGLWEQIVPIHVGFDMGLEELSRGSVDAVWMVVGYPNLALARHNRGDPLRWLDLFSDTDSYRERFLESFPFYRMTKIPAGTYRSQDRDVSTFRDDTLLLARSDLSADTVYDLLKLLYQPQVRERLARRHHLGRELAVMAEGNAGEDPPLHGGASRFWKEYDAHR